jgi:hypothetical protein
MKASLGSPYSFYLKAMLLIVVLSVSSGGPTVAQTGEPQGYLMVYSATDPFDDGDVPYYAHSSYSIYTSDGKFYKNVENHISRSDEIPSLVTLPAGSYTIEVRSESHGYVRLPVFIAAGQRTVLDPDKPQAEIHKGWARTKHSRHLAENRSAKNSNAAISFQF